MKHKHRAATKQSKLSMRDETKGQGIPKTGQGPAIPMNNRKRVAKEKTNCQKKNSNDKNSKRFVFNNIGQNL